MKLRAAPVSTQPSIRADDGEVPVPLPEADALAYSDCFSCLAEPTRVRLLHAVAVAERELGVGELAERVGVSQPTASHHLRKLAETGFVLLRKAGTSTLVRVNEGCCTGLPHAAEVVMGVLGAQPCRSMGLAAGVTLRPMRARDWPAVRRIYAEGIATGNATFETEVPPQEHLDRHWLPGHRWVAELDGTVAGWAALTRVSERDCYAGVVETSLYVGEGVRGRGIGGALVRQQVEAADLAGLWTLQTSVFPENRASLAVHRAAGFRIVGVRERIAQLHGRWRDTVLLERRSPAVGPDLP